ncbi:MAG: cupredoxin domain-containing protein [Betaproteobacteria bacterium]|nr:cupredoxin domain-containing protein [Betaproteobacteria bacterium]
MKSSKRLVAAFAVGLAACQSLPEPSPADKAKVVAETDWNRATSVKIDLRDAGFSPPQLNLVAGRPYRLTITNVGANNHYLNAPEFFGSIATRRAEVPRHAEVYMSRIDRVEVFAAGGSVDLWFVPLAKGRFRAHCHLGNHAEMGVEGLIVVE